MDSAHLLCAGSSLLIHGEKVTTHNGKTLIGEGDHPSGAKCVAIANISAAEVAFIKETGEVVICHSSSKAVVRTVAFPLGEGKNIKTATCGVVGPKSLPSLSKLLLQQDSSASPHKAGDAVVIASVADTTSKTTSVQVFNTRTMTITLLWAASAAEFTVTHVAVSFPDPHTIGVAGATATKKNLLQAILLGNNTKQRDGFTKTVACQNPTTALSVHPFQAQISVGDTQGRIRTWSLPEATMKEVHWHSHSVSTLSWSPDGTVLVSGGEEAVLCIWNARSWESNKIPRLGGTIIGAVWGGSATVTIGVSPSQLTCIDLIQKKPIRTVHGAALLRGQPAEGITTIPTKAGEAIVMYGRGVENSIRVFDPLTRTYLKTLKVSTVNTTSRVDSNPLPSVRIVDVAFSATGDHMVTVEKSDVSTFQQANEIILKFWSASDAQDAADEYVVNTYVNNPHKPSFSENFDKQGDRARSFAVTSVQLSAKGDCFTLSSDGCVKKWSFASGKWQHSATTFITCSDARKLEVSADGSVIACIADGFAKVMRTSDLSELKTLDQHASAAPLEDVLFLSGDEGSSESVLVSHSSTHLFAWDVAAGTLLYAVSVPVKCMTRLHEESMKYIVAVQGGVLLCFCGVSAVPVSTASLAASTLNPTKMIVPKSRSNKNAAFVLYIENNKMDRAESKDIKKLLGGAATVETEEQGSDAPGARSMPGLGQIFAQKASAGAGAGAGNKGCAYQRPAASCKTLQTVFLGDTHSVC